MVIKNMIVGLLILSGGVAFSLGLYALKHRHRMVSLPFCGMMLIFIFYTWGYAFELYNVTLEGIKLALKIEYLGISFIPAAWIVMAVIYTGRQKLLTPAMYFIIFFIPVVTLLLHFTNDLHHLFYKDLSISHDAPFPLAVITRGVWYHIHVIYINIAVLIGNIIYLRWIIRKKGSYRRQGAAMFTASLAPWVGNFVYQFGLTPYGIDIIPFCLTFSGALFALALFRYRILDISPIARDLIFDRMEDPVIVIDTLYRVMDFNPVSRDIICLKKKHPVGESITDVLCGYPELIGQIMAEKNSYIEMMADGWKGKRFFRSLFTPIIRKGRKLGTIVTLNDITEHNHMMIKLNELATKDELTGVYNRRHFFALSRHEISKAMRNRHPFSVILIDLDHFKSINDAYGHSVGDQVLISAAANLVTGLREIDVFGRYGGEEFTIFLPETLPEHAAMIADRLRKRLSALTITSDAGDITITASFGIAGGVEPNGKALDDLLKMADTALYTAKKNGRNRVEIYNDNYSCA